jgi:hypothetical protein
MTYGDIRDELDDPGEVELPCGHTVKLDLDRWGIDWPEKMQCPECYPQEEE